MVHWQIAPRGVARNAPLGLGGNGHKFGTEFVADAHHVVFVLLAVVGACAVHQVAALAQGGPYTFDNLPLAGHATVDGLWRPFVNGHSVLAEHALARAWHIGRYHIEETAQWGKLFGVGRGAYHVGVSPLGQILGQYLGALADRFIGHKQVAVAHQAAPQGALAARGCAKVEQTVGRKVGCDLLVGLLYKH